MRKMSFNSILPRMFISFLLIILPIILAGIAMIIWEKQTIENQQKDSALNNISFLKANLENEVRNIKLLQNNLANDNTLSRLVTQYTILPKYESYMLIREVRDRMQVIQYNNNYIDNVLVYIPGIEGTISVTGGYLGFDETEFSRLFSKHREARYPLTMDSSEIYSTVIYPFNASSSRLPLYLTKIVLAQDKIEMLLNSFNEDSVNNTALYDYSSGNWVFSSKTSLVANNADLFLDNSSSDGTRDAVVSLEGEKYYVISVYSDDLNVAFIQYLPIDDIFYLPERFSRYLWIYIVLSVFIVLAYSWFIDRFVKRPVNSLLKSFRLVENGDLNIQVKLKAANEFNDLFNGFNKMVFRLNEQIDKSFRQELFAKKSELKQLQSQINPHFLYNSYFILHRMIKDEDQENAEALSSYLGEYLKYITRNAADEIPLHKELEHAQSYLKIQQMCFSENLTVEIDRIPEGYREFLVPRIILQPILENAFEHGLKPALKNGMIHISFTEIGTGLVITIEDNGVNLEDGDIETIHDKLVNEGNHIETSGMINVHRRIVLKYAPGSGIYVSRGSLGGLRVEIRILC